MANREAFAIGKAVVVHANPDDPSEAFVDVSFPWLRIIELALSIAGLVWALGNIDEIQRGPHYSRTNVLKSGGPQ